MATFPVTSDSRQAFIDLAGPLCFDDADPVYPYHPPSMETCIDELACKPPHCFKSVSISVPNRPRTLSITKAVNALARLLASSACLDLETFRVAGQLHLLNDKEVQAGLRGLALHSLILQEPQALADTYALAGLLSAANGIQVLQLSLSSNYSKVLHPTFQEETRETLSKIKKLELSLRGDVVRMLSDVFPAGSLESLETLDIYYENCIWSAEATAILKCAIPSHCPLTTIKVTRSGSDARVRAACDIDPLLPLLAVPALQNISLIAQSPEESLRISPGALETLPSGLKSLELIYASPPDLLGLYRTIQASLPTFSQLEKVNLTHTYPVESAHKMTDDWEIIRVSAGHPAAARNCASTLLSRLAAELELANVSYRLRLTGPKIHEERASLSTMQKEME